jgi:hypothetical protein
MRLDSSGRLGLGTSSPGQKLSIGGSGGTLDGAAAISLFDGNSAASRRWSISNGAGGNAIDLYGKLVIGYGSSVNADPMTGTAAVVIDSSGRVGIGTTASPGKLTVSTSSANPTAGLSTWTDGYSVVSPGGTSTSGGVGFSFNTTDNIGGISCATPGTAWRDLIYKASAHRFELGSNEAARIDSSGRLLVGTSTGIAIEGSQQAQVQVENIYGFTSNYRVNNQFASTIGFVKSRGTNAEIVQNGDALGSIVWYGADGTDYQTVAARISALVDGDPGANDLPSRLVFSTTADGASSPTGRMWITSAGRVGIGVSNPDSVFNVQVASDGLDAITAQSANQTGLLRLRPDGTNGNVIRVGGSGENSGVLRFLAIADAERARIDSSGNMLLGGTVSPSSATKAFAVFNGTAPTGSVTDGVVLYAEDVSASSELKVRDEAGNVTTLSPHNFDLIPDGPSEDMAWSYYSERDGKRINVDMLKAIRLLEQISGEKLVYSS